MRAPGNGSELDDALLRAWNAKLAQDFQVEVEGTRTVPRPAYPRAWFFDAVTEGLDRTQTRDIAWTAYPKKAKQASWGLVDRQRDAQEEYCEWEVARRDGKVVRVTFTTETQDYYQFLWQQAPDLLLDLYRRFVSPQVRLEDLGSGGQYNPRNAWNLPTERRGALMHMAQVNNTLGAAMNLAARATWPLVDAAGQPIISEQELIHALQFGDPERHSDPHIGAQVNELVRAGHEISLADPPGLYIQEVDLSDVETPDGRSPQELVRRTRGEEGYAMRLVFEVPAGAGYVLEDVTVAGRRLHFGSQLAERIKVRLRGAARSAAEPAPRLRYPGFSVSGEDAMDGPQALASLREEGGPLAAARRSDALESILSPE